MLLSCIVHFVTRRCRAGQAYDVHRNIQLSSGVTNNIFYAWKLKWDETTTVVRKNQLLITCDYIALGCIKRCTQHVDKWGVFSHDVVINSLRSFDKITSSDTKTRLSACCVKYYDVTQFHFVRRDCYVISALFVQ